MAQDEPVSGSKGALLQWRITLGMQYAPSMIVKQRRQSSFTRVSLALFIGVFRLDEDGSNLRHGAARKLLKDDAIRADFLTEKPF